MELSNGAYVFYVFGSKKPGYFDSDLVIVNYVVRPVLSLKSCVTWKSGNGASSTPYEVEINSNCAFREN